MDVLGHISVLDVSLVNYDSATMLRKTNFSFLHLLHDSCGLSRLRLGGGLGFGWL